MSLFLFIFTERICNLITSFFCQFTGLQLVFWYPDYILPSHHNLLDLCAWAKMNKNVVFGFMYISLFHKHHLLSLNVS